MNFNYIVTFTILIGFLMLLFQRTETTKRRMVLTLMVIPAILIGIWANYRDMEIELLIAVVLAFIINVLFWLMIGKYNPVPSSDNIKVLKLDD